MRDKYVVTYSLSNMKSSGEYEDEMRRIAQVQNIKISMLSKWAVAVRVGSSFVVFHHH